MENKTIPKTWIRIFETLTETQKRWMAADKAIELGYGGITIVSEATGLSRTTVHRGIDELKSRKKLANGDRQRAEGGGRKRASDIEDGLVGAIDSILDETTAGDPMSAIKWTNKSVRAIAEQLNEMGFNINFNTVNRLLNELGYSLQSNRKSLSRASNPDRDRQFKLINRKISKFLNEGSPVISVDTKKKEIIGNFKNSGQVWRKKGDPKLVEDHDFPSRSGGKAIPYGTYDIGKNQGFVNVGISADTADFAVNSILRWWNDFGTRNYLGASRILICADGGGSNGSRNRLWKYNLQRFADKTGLEVFVAHYPPGTSKWNKIEHRMFSYISSHWRGQPLESYEAVIQLIGSTSTKSGLKIKAKLDKRKYLTGKKISDEIFDQINLTNNKVLPKWNYSIEPL